MRTLQTSIRSELLVLLGLMLGLLLVVLGTAGAETAHRAVTWSGATNSWSQALNGAGMKSGVALWRY